MDIPRVVGQLFSSYAIAAGITIVGIIYFANVISPASLGAFFLFQAVFMVLAAVSDFGIGVAIEKRVSDGYGLREVLGAALALKLTVVGFFSCLIWFAAPLLNESIGPVPVIPLIGAFGLRHFSILIRHALKGDQRVGDTAIFNVLRQGVWFGLGAVLVLFGWDSLGLIYGLVIGTGSVVILGIYRLGTIPAFPSLPNIRNLLEIARWSWIGDLGDISYSWIDVLFIGYFLTPAAVGVYEVAWRIAAVTLLLNQAVHNATFPVINAEGSPSSTERMTEILYSTITPSLYFVVPAFVGVVVLGSDILGLIFGPEYVAASLVLLVLIVEKVFRALTNVLKGPIYALNRADVDGKVTTLAMGANIGLNLLLIPTFGILGVAIATMFAEAANFGARAAFLRRNMVLDFPYRDITVCTLFALAMGGVLQTTRFIVPPTSISSLIALIFIGFSVYLLLTLMEPSFRSRILGVVS